MRPAAPLLLTMLLGLQVTLAVRVLARLIRTSRGRPIERSAAAPLDTVTIVIPTLNEEERLAGCLEGAIQQGPEVKRILVVDGGSTDGTRVIVDRFARVDSRVTWVSAAPVPDDWNGKAWGLEVGASERAGGSHRAPSSRFNVPGEGRQTAAPWNLKPGTWISEGPGRPAPWLLTIDADTFPREGLARALLAHAEREGLAALSVATQQELGTALEGLIHPALLATLVYRFGIPGCVSTSVEEVQANGQCMLIRRDALEDMGGFAAIRASRCEDVTLARLLVARGHRVGFAEAGDLIRVRMYQSGWETLMNWSRSLPLRDDVIGWRWALGLLEVTLVQALPLLVCSGRFSAPREGSRALVRLLQAFNILLLLTRIGVLVGMARAYPRRPWTYWLSPLLDLPMALVLWWSALWPRHTWRGRPLVEVSA